MKHLFTVLLALAVLVAIVPVATAGSTPCVINCPSMSPGCYALALAKCTGGWIEGSVIWFWGATDPEPILTAEVPSYATLPEDHFQALRSDQPGSVDQPSISGADHPWGGESYLLRR